MAASRPSWILSRKKRLAYVSHHSLSVCQVWTRLVDVCLRNGWGHVRHMGSFTIKMAASQAVGHLWSDGKMKWGVRACHHVLCLCQVWTQSDHACLRNGWGHIWGTKWPLVGHLGSDVEKKWRGVCVNHHSLSVPMLNEIGGCMSDKWWTTCSTPCVFNEVGHLWSHREIKTKWCAYVHHHLLSFCNTSKYKIKYTTFYKYK